MSSATDTPTARCFGQRMLSPYRGIMHSVVTQWADAVTTDGREWTLYVRGECLYDDLAELESEKVTVPDVKYGTWSKKTGFQRSPIRLPTFDGKVRHEGEKLLEAVKANAPDLPFPLADRFELWLLHGKTHKPMALIASSCSTAVEEPTLLRWTPGQHCMAELAHSRALFETINTFAGAQPRAAWFERHADGSGTPIISDTQSNKLISEALAAKAFAEFFIDTDVLDAEQTAWFEQLLEWQAPALLQLPGLSDEQRTRFETAACRHALRLAEQLPLYPCVLDNAKITAALVEARLRRSTGKPVGIAKHNDNLSPDYIEIPDT